MFCRDIRFDDSKDLYQFKLKINLQKEKKKK